MIQKLKNYLWHFPKAIFFSAWYGFPARKLTMIGVTGTKGKTTTAHMIYHILRFAPLRSNLCSAKVRPCVAGLISTIGAFFSATGRSAFGGGDEEIDTGLHVTSPDPRELQKLLKIAVNRGLTNMVLEVTSSGLDQFRVWGIKFKVAVITNIYPDHLDYHRTMEKYVEAKAKIIRQSEVVVLPKNFRYFNELKKIMNQRPKANLPASRLTAPAGWQAGGQRPKVIFFSEDKSIVSSNKAAAAAAGEVLGVPKAEAKKALMDFKGVKGRLETVHDKDFKVVIDFAHTPESLAAALGDLRKLVKKNGRLVAVFGCAGERDHGRRRMGQVAAKMTDFFVITAEDPRTETVEGISDEIAGWAVKAGVKDIGKINRQIDKQINRLIDEKIHFFIKIPDRQEAINYAISTAKPGDVVGLFGKGHEKSMCYGKEERPWSEYEAVEKALKYVRNIRLRREK